MIRLSKVRKEFAGGRVALRDVSFDVAAGEMVLVTGPSGSGKSVLVRILFGAETLTDGQGIVGGRNLDGPSPRYLYLMVRPTGEYMVRRRVGSATETLVDWMPHDAVQGVLADGDSPVNSIAIEARGSDVRFLVNGIVVFLLPLEEARPNGVAGLRVNHRLDLVLTSWSLGPPQPPPPSDSLALISRSSEAAHSASGDPASSAAIRASSGSARSGAPIRWVKSSISSLRARMAMPRGA